MDKNGALSLNKVDSQLANMLTEQEISIKYQQDIIKKTELMILRIENNISGIKKRLEPYVIDGKNLNDSEINYFVGLKQDYDKLVLELEEHKDTIIMAEEFIAEAQLGMDSATVEGTGTTLGAINND